MLGTATLALHAQDDMYFVPTKQNVARDRAAYYGTTPVQPVHSGSWRSIDDYNRRWGTSQYEVLPADTGDIVSFAAIEGIYPDSLGDFSLTQRMSRFDGYEPSSDYWAGYANGRRDSWHSPWYYSGYYPWYSSYWFDTYWYDPWYWNYGWYDPWYYGYGYYYRPWYNYYYYGGGGGGYAHHYGTATRNHGRIVGSRPRSSGGSPA